MADIPNLFLICGHGDGDSGACGNGFNEADRVRLLATKIKYFGGDYVTIGDTLKNWYRDNLINQKNIPKGSEVLELHMDSSEHTSARGAHVIIQADFKPDKYDEALANFISSILSGRADKIVKRNDLANPRRAAFYGFPYRLLECGFISNSDDVKIFNYRMDEIAKGILKSFDIPIDAPKVDQKYYRIQLGAYTKKENAEKKLAEVKSKGFTDAFIKYS